MSYLISLRFFIQQHPTLLVLFCVGAFATRSEVRRVVSAEKNQTNRNWDLVWFHGRREVTDNTQDSSPAHANGGLEYGKESELGLMGLVFLVNCFELFLKENPSSHAVNICCGISGLSQVQYECVSIRLFWCAFLNLHERGAGIL